MATNNVLNNQCLNDFTVTRSNSGGSNLLIVTNTSNTASSAAIVRASVAGTSAGDALYQAVITGGSTWTWGADNSDSDSWKLNPSSSLGSGDLLAVDATGNFTFNYQGSGSTGGLIVNNVNNTASSQAYITINTVGTSAGRQVLQFSNTVDSLFSISRASATNSPLIFSAGNPGTNDNLTIDSSGRMTNALQPCFSAYLASNDSNVTGDGTDYNLGDTSIGNTLTELYDRGGNFTPGASGGAVFTAPVAGIYHFDTNSMLTGLGAGNTEIFVGFIYSVGPTYYYGTCVSGAARTAANIMRLNCSIDISMAAGSTLKAFVRASAGAKTVGLDGTAIATWWNGHLIC